MIGTVTYLAQELIEGQPASPASAEVQQRLAALGQPATSPLDRLMRGRLVGREQELADATTIWLGTAYRASRFTVGRGSGFPPRCAGMRE